MPSYYFREIWTPLKYIGIRLFQETAEKTYWVKVGKKRRKRLFGN